MVSVTNAFRRGLFRSGNRNWAPGCGRSFLITSGISGGQSDRSTMCAASAAQAPSRMPLPVS